MKVEIIKDYLDTTLSNSLVTVGTVFTVSAERGKVLISAGVAKEIKKKTK